MVITREINEEINLEKEPDYENDEADIKEYPRIGK